MNQINLPDFVEIPDGLPEALRIKLNLASGEKLRLCYLSLANDVARVQQFWAQGLGDPRSQKATYAGMFFELVDKLGGQGLLVSQFDTEPPSDQAVKIAKIDRQLEKDGQKTVNDQVVEQVTTFQPHLVVVSPSISAEIIPKLYKICPTVYYAHSLFWPLNWDHGVMSLKDRARKLVRGRRHRKNLSGISGLLASSDISLRQTQKMIGDGLPFAVTRNQYIQPPQILNPKSAQNMLYVGEFSDTARVDLIIEAYKMVAAETAGIKLTMIGTGPKNDELSALGAKIDGLEVHVGFDAHKIQAELQAAGLVIVADDFSAKKALPTYLPEALIQGVPALISSNVPANPEEQAHCETFQSGDLADLVRRLKLLVTDDQAYQALCAKLPMDAAPYYDRSQSWGSGIARLFAKIYGIS